MPERASDRGLFFGGTRASSFVCAPRKISSASEACGSYREPTHARLPPVTCPPQQTADSFRPFAAAGGR